MNIASGGVWGLCLLLFFPGSQPILGALLLTCGRILRIIENMYMCLSMKFDAMFR